MNKKTLTLFLLMLVMAGCYKTLACADYPSYISGPSDMELDNASAPTSAGYQFVMNMSSGYKSSSGGYFGTQWTFDGLGVVGYGETLTLSTSGWTLPYGTYTLTARNQFGSSASCYGCISNTTFTWNVTLSPHRPDLIIQMIETNIPDQVDENHSYTVKYKVTNKGSSSVSGCNVRISFVHHTSLGDTQGPITNDVTTPLAAGGGSFTTTATVTTPGVTANQDNTTLTFVADPDNYIVEQNETNNKDEYPNKTVVNVGGRIANEQDDTFDPNLISITDLGGNHIWHKGDPIFDTNQLKPGIYVFKTQNGKKVKSQTIVKK